MKKNIVKPNVKDSEKRDKVATMPMSDYRTFMKEKVSATPIVVTIPMGKYGEFFLEFGSSLKTTDPDVVYSTHQAYCANCGVHFTKEALQHLSLFGPKSGFGSTLVAMGASRQGNNIRAGRCPICGHSEMKIVISSDVSERLSEKYPKSA